MTALEQYLNPPIKNPRRLATLLRYRIIKCLGHQSLIDEFIRQYDAYEDVYERLALCRNEVGSILMAAHRRKAQANVFDEPDETHTLIEAVKYAQWQYNCAVEANGTPGVYSMRLGRAIQAAQAVGVEVRVDSLGRVVSIDGMAYRHESLLDGAEPDYAKGAGLSPEAAKVQKWGQ